MKKSVLFICNRNAGRSQMAEGLLNALYGDRYTACSAGFRPASSISPFTRMAMEDAGIDISRQRPKAVDAFFGMEFDYIVLLCQPPAHCTDLPRTRHLMHATFADPATISGTPDEIRFGFRRIRERIGRWLEETFSQEESS